MNKKNIIRTHMIQHSLKQNLQNTSMCENLILYIIKKIHRGYYKMARRYGFYQYLHWWRYGKYATGYFLVKHSHLYNKYNYSTAPIKSQVVTLKYFQFSIKCLKKSDVCTVVHIPWHIQTNMTQLQYIHNDITTKIWRNVDRWGGGGQITKYQHQKDFKMMTLSEGS